MFFDAETVEQLAEMLHNLYTAELIRQIDAGTMSDMLGPPATYEELSDQLREYDRVLARFILHHCDEFTVANLLAHRTGACVEREVEA